MEKFHEHDCDCCVHLASEEFDGDKFDLYFCEQGGFESTVIARFGQDGDYASGLGIVKSLAKEVKEQNENSSLKDSVEFLLKNSDSSTIAILSKATLLAIDAGLINENLESCAKPKKLKM